MRPLLWRTLRWAAALFLVAPSIVGVTRGGANRAASRPPVILIVVDTLRADFLGSYGYPGGSSPNLDALARRGVRFERAFSQAPWTKPSVASLLTGMHPRTHGVTNHEGRAWGSYTGVLPDSLETLAESFRRAGYRTGAFVTNTWLNRGYGFEQGFDTYDDSVANDAGSATPALQAAEAWLDAAPDDRPFFLYLHLFDVHGPYLAPESDRAAIDEAAEHDADRTTSDEEFAAIPPYMLKPDWTRRPEARSLREWRARYAAGVHALDRRIGDFVATLERTGVLDRALLIVTSDHGEELAEHGSWTHGDTLYDHQTHVPLILLHPGAPAGRTVEPVVSLVDVMPTVLAEAGIAAPPGVQGRDLSGWIRSGPPAPLGPSFATASYVNPFLGAVRTERYKLIHDSWTGETQLFDLVADPGERTDLSSRHPEIAERMRGQLTTWIASTAAAAPSDLKVASVPEEVSERLAALGYLH